jgi:hypothetical protein
VATYFDDVKHLEVYFRDYSRDTEYTVDSGKAIRIIVNPDEERNSLNRLRFKLSVEQTKRLITDLQDGLKSYNKQKKVGV